MNKKRSISSPLTPRDWDVVRATCTDRTVDEVCAFLGMNRASYYAHMSFIQEKWGCKTRAGVVLEATAGEARNAP